MREEVGAGNGRNDDTLSEDRRRMRRRGVGRKEMGSDMWYVSPSEYVFCTYRVRYGGPFVLRSTILEHIAQSLFRLGCIETIFSSMGLPNFCFILYIYITT